MSTTTPDYRFVFGNEYLHLPTAEQTWVIEPLIPAGGLVNIYGKPKEAKKSWMGLNMALAISNGWDTLMGTFPVRTWGPVAYLQVDTPRSLWMPRFELMAKSGHDLSLIGLADPELVPYPMDLLDEEANHTGILIDMMAESFGSMTPLVVFVDTLREVHSGDEDKSTIMRNVVARLRTAFRGSAIVLISHSRKGAGEHNGSVSGGQGPDSDDGSLMDENRGSGYIAGRMDTVIRLTPKYMSYQGRAVGKERVRIDFDHTTGLFLAGHNPVTARAKELAGAGDSERGIARTLAQEMHITEAAARSTLRRQRK